MTCAIMQPTYLPWLGYFDLIDQVDKFVFLDDVQLVKRSWMVRNRIKTDQGPLFLTIPVQKTESRDNQLIINTEIDDIQNWKIKHLRSIHRAYTHSDHFDNVFAFIEELISEGPSNLASFNMNIIIRIAEKINIENAIFRSSELDNQNHRKDDKLLKICQILQCDTYISPQGSSSYLEKNTPGGAFGKSKIALYYMNYEHPIYPQLFGEFISHMCIIDLLFNVGFEKALEIIRSGRRTNYFYTEFRKNILHIS